MQVVIDIPEKLVCEGFERPFTEEEKNTLIKAIGNGTPLPKGHGRLIDADDLIQELSVVSSRPIKSQLYILKEAPTIIAADKSESEGME